MSGATNRSAPPPKVAQITPQSEATQPGTAVQRPPASSSAQPTDEAARFASKVLRQNEDRWREIFEKSGNRYQAPHLVLFRGRVQSACGLAQSAMGPFYCPFDRKIYLDTSLFAELEKRFHGCSGKACQFSKAYVIAREYGHHVQNLLGILPKVQQLQRGLSKTEANRMQIRVELQADCLAGVWANRQQREAVFLDPGDALFAEDAATQLVGTWRLASWLTRFDGGEPIEPYGPNATGRLVLTPDRHWIIVVTGANRKAAKSVEEKATLLDSMLAYTGTYTVEADKIITHVEISSNEIYTGANQDQTRFFRIEGDKLILRTPEIVSAVRPGQKAVGTITFERER